MTYTPIWGTGFEMGAHPYRPAMYEYFQGVGSCLIVAGGHTGAYTCRQYHNADGYFIIYHAKGRSDVALGFWTYDSGTGGADVKIYLQDGNYISILRSGLSNYAVTVNGSTVATGTFAVNHNTWHNVQLQALINDAGYIKTMIDGTLDIDYSGDTKPGSNALINYIKYAQMGAGFQYLYYDDLSVGYGDWPGDLRYDVMYPTADTATHDWLPGSASLQATPAAPDVAVGAAGGLTGNYRYKCTLVDPYGETLGSVASALVAPASQKVELSNIPTGLADWTTARKIYRTVAGGAVYKLVTTLNATDVTYSDNIADGALGAEEPANVHYSQIDERPPSDADFIRTAVDGAKDLHDLSSWLEDAKVPRYVIQWARLRKETADMQTAKIAMQSGATYSAGAELPLNSQYEYFSRTVENDPATDAAWTAAGINGMQSGVEAVVPA